MIESLVEQIESRFGELSRLITDPEVIGDRNRYADVGREYRRLEPAAKLAERWRHAKGDADGARELIAEGSDDAEVRDMLSTAEEELSGIEDEIRFAMDRRNRGRAYPGRRNGRQSLLASWQVI